MSDIYIEKSHTLGLQTARTHAQKWLDEAKSQFGIEVTYTQGDTQDTATITKAGVDAKATLTEHTIVFEATLAFLAKPLKGAISSGIQEGLNKYFS